MRRAVPIASLIFVALTSSQTAVAQVLQCNLVSPGMSTAPLHVTVAAFQAGTPDPAGLVEVLVHSGCNQPMANVQVIVDLGACSDVRLCTAAVPGQTVDCATNTVRTFTDASGIARLYLVGSGTTTGGGPGAGPGCGRILADGANLAFVTVNVLDLNGAVGASGVDVTDFTAWLRDFGTGGYFGRSDYSRDGALGVSDLAVWFAAFGSGASSNGCPVTYCP